jgi:hypothetical protein
VRTAPTHVCSERMCMCQTQSSWVECVCRWPHTCSCSCDWPAADHLSALLCLRSRRYLLACSELRRSGLPPTVSTSAPKGGTCAPMAIRVAVLSLRKSVTYTHTPPRAYTGRPRRRRSQPSWKVLASSPTTSLPSQAHLRRRVSLPPRDQIHSYIVQSITHHTSS